MKNNRKKAVVIAILLVAGIVHASAQNVHTILADSVKITGATGAGELILLNSTKDTAAYLFNRGKGRTAFAPLLRKVNDSIYISGTDTVKLALKKYAALNTPDTIVGAKTFSPVISNANGTVAGAVVNASFVAQAQDTLIGADFGVVQVTNSANTRFYSAYFYDKVVADDEMYFQLGSHTKNTGEMVLGTWASRTNETEPITIVKPAHAFPEQFNFASIHAGVTTSSVLKSGLGFKDSVIFTDGTQDYSFMKFNPVLTQQPGATGVLRAISIQPLLTGAKSFRGLQVDVNKANGQALYLPGTASVVLGGVAQYQANYSDSFNARTLADKNYADSLVLGSWRRGNGNSIYKTDSVVIGRSAPGAHLLAVDGTILARLVKVTPNDVNWADYVFDSAYVPMPLNQVQAFVQQHRHLPGMPAAAEVEREGVDVVASQAALLKQVEELTLHLIRQHKKLNEQGKDLKQLSADIQKLPKLAVPFNPGSRSIE